MLSDSGCAPMSLKQTALYHSLSGMRRGPSSLGPDDRIQQRKTGLLSNLQSQIHLEELVSGKWCNCAIICGVLVAQF